MDIFQTLGSGSLSVTAILDFSGKANIFIHGLGEDDTASFGNDHIVCLITNATWPQKWIPRVRVKDKQLNHYRVVKYVKGKE